MDHIWWSDPVVTFISNLKRPTLQTNNIHWDRNTAAGCTSLMNEYFKYSLRLMANDKYSQAMYITFQWTKGDIATLDSEINISRQLYFSKERPSWIPCSFSINAACYMFKVGLCRHLCQTQWTYKGFINPLNFPAFSSHHRCECGVRISL